VEIVGPSDGVDHGHAWLKWLGLQEPPPGADSWVPVARGSHLDEVAEGVDQIATRAKALVPLDGLELLVIVIGAASTSASTMSAR
jgi:hypothetical protein